MSEAEDILRNAEPGWKSVPVPPTRLRPEEGIDSKPCDFAASSVSVEETSNLPEPALPVSTSLPGEEGGTSGTFICSYNKDKGTISVGPGSYENPLGTNTDVAATGGVGKYAYAIIKHSSAGVFGSFRIEVSSSPKDPVKMDAKDFFVEFSNVLLAEVVGEGDDTQLVQRRVGNVTLYHRVIDGDLCLWPETTSGSTIS